MKRYEVVASKGKQVIYKKSFNPVEAQITEWDLKMSGYKTRLVITEEERR